MILLQSHFHHVMEIILHDIILICDLAHRIDQAAFSVTKTEHVATEPVQSAASAIIQCYDCA